MTRANIEYKLDGKVKKSPKPNLAKINFVSCGWSGLYMRTSRTGSPLEMDKMRLIDEKAHPFYKHAEAKFFIAEDKARPSEELPLSSITRTTKFIETEQDSSFFRMCQ